jgi:hypothetical protein
VPGSSRRRGAARRIDRWLPRVLEDGPTSSPHRPARGGGDAGQRWPTRALPRARDGPDGQRRHDWARRDERDLPAAGHALQRPGCPDAMTVGPVERVEELARLGGFERLRDFGVPEADLDELGASAAARPGAKANPRPVTASDAADLYRAVW